MGEEFTAEELVILGETPEPKEGAQAPPEGEAEPTVEGEVKPPAEGVPTPEKEPAHTEEEKKVMEEKGLKIDAKGFVVDDEGTRIPAKRWKKLYFDAKEADRKRVDAETGKTKAELKFKLFKERGPEEYYTIYPDEKPEGYQPAPTGPAKAQAQDDPFNLVAQYPDPNHPFHGKTLREIYSEDPAEGRRLERFWEQGQQQARANEQRQRETAVHANQRLVKESEEEIITFAGSIAKDLFSKEAAALTKEEEAQVSQTIQDTLNFMQKTRRGAGILADAYFLMHKEKILSDAKTKGGKAALESLSRPGVLSISAGNGAASTGMDAYEVMTSDQLAREVDGMTDKQFIHFKKTASQALKAKHPSISWD